MQAQPSIVLPEQFVADDSGVLLPLDEQAAQDAQVRRGPNIKEFPVGSALENELAGQIVLKVGDNITTDHIMPAGAKILPYRSNIPFLSNFCFEVCDPEFPKRAKETANGIILGGENYGQGSSREHAALVPMYLGVRCVIAKSFARIHVANLINAGILPLILANTGDYDALAQGENVTLTGIHAGMKDGVFTAQADGKKIILHCALSDRQRSILMAGGLLRYIGEGGL